MILSRQQQSNKGSDDVAVVFVSSEVAPFSKTGGLGDVAGSLPQALAETGCQVAVLTPKYGFISEEIRRSMTHVCDFTVALSWRNSWCGVDYLRYNDMDYYFIDNEDYFKRPAAYGYFDDGERFAFFSKAVCESLQHIAREVIDFRCDVLHCNDWQTALVPVFLGEFYQGIDFYRSIKTVFTVHNVKFQGQYSNFVLGDICGLADMPAAVSQLTSDEYSINYMQGGLNYADWLSTVSPTYAEELKTAEFGEGMELVFNRRESVFSGILNGIDQDEYNPVCDEYLPANYSVADRAGKAVCKQKLQHRFSLEENPDIPLIVMISRLTEQKGVDLVAYGLADILRQGVQVIILGTGDFQYEECLRSFEREFPDTMRFVARFDVSLSHRMYAAADLFLMPSRFEPCGLSQIIAMRYGALPVVRETGGLKDTVEPYNRYTGEGTGFSFAHFNGEEFKDCVTSAVELFRTNQNDWNRLVTAAMEKDFSWHKSALEYKRIYEHLAWLGRGYQPASD